MRLLVALFALSVGPQTLAQTASLAGTVRDSLGRPVPGLTVEVVANDGVRPRTVLDAATADSAGAFRLEFDRVGVHVLRVRSDADVPVAPEAPLYTDHPSAVAADLVLASATAPLRLRYMDEDSRPARAAEVFEYGGPSAGGLPPGAAPSDGLEDVVAVKAAADARRASALDPDLARSTLALVPPGSPAWVGTGNPYLVLQVIDQTGEPAAYADYVERFAAEQPDPDPVAGVVYEVLGRARLAYDSLRVVRYLALVRERGLAESYWGSRALVEFSADRAVRPGEPVPTFSFPTLDGEGAVTAEDLAGRVYLLDFWATWCSPCVAERDELAALYEDHRDRGFEIVSVSFDFAPDDVDLERWPMPWLHAHLAPEEPETEAAMEAFALGSLPKLVLVGEDGNVIAGGIELRPEVVSRILPNVLD
jgi:thiol-disulfide isomerase/thioredoxin